MVYMSVTIARGLASANVSDPTSPLPLDLLHAGTLVTVVLGNVVKAEA